MELDPLSLTIAGLAVPVVTELLTLRDPTADTKPVKRLVATVVTAAVIGLDLAIEGAGWPGWDVVAGSFMATRAVVEGGHAAVDGVTKYLGVDLDRVLAPNIGVPSGRRPATDPPPARPFR